MAKDQIAREFKISHNDYFIKILLTKNALSEEYLMWFVLYREKLLRFPQLVVFKLLITDISSRYSSRWQVWQDCCHKVTWMTRFDEEALKNEVMVMKTIKFCFISNGSSSYFFEIADRVSRNVFDLYKVSQFQTFISWIVVPWQYHVTRWAIRFSGFKDHNSISSLILGMGRLS